MSDIEIKLEPQDEFNHQPDEASNYNESMYFNVFDHNKKMGGWFRLGNRPNEGYAEMTCCIYLPDGRIGFMFGRPEITTNDFFDAGGMKFDVIDPLERTATVQSDGAITAPMPGLVKQVFVHAGQEVAAGDPIVVLEAMKMQHTLCADHAGRVENLTARQDQQVDAGVVLAVIETAQEEA